MIDVEVRGGPVSGLVGKSRWYTPFSLYWSASLIGVEGFKKEIPLSVVRRLPLIVTGGLFLRTYTSVTFIEPYLKEP